MPRGSDEPLRIDELRKAIEQHLRATNVFADIRQILAEHLQDGGTASGAGADQLLDIVRERGLIREVLAKLSGPTGPAPVPSRRAVGSLLPAQQQLNPSHRYLHVKLLGGRAFLDNLDAEVSTDASRHDVAVHLQFGSQRFQSNPVACVCDPAWDDDFLIDLDAERQQPQHQQVAAVAFGLQQHRDLLRLSVPLTFVVLKRDRERQQRHYIGENSVEWRKVLRNGVVSMSVELGGGAAGLKVPVGILEMQIELVPTPNSRTSVPEDEITAQISLERTQKQAADREFLVYARRWWGELHSLETAERRPVKVFANLMSAGPSVMPVTSWVTPLRADRLLESPQQAARFISLLGVEEDVAGTAAAVAYGSTAGGDGWLSTYGFLLKGRGPISNHCILLCNLLLGFELDAYVVLGHDDTGPHMWVLTRADGEVTFWESLSGTRHRLRDQHKYLSLGCVFNHNVLYANVQATDQIQSCSFEFENDGLWKAMSPMKLKLTRKQAMFPLALLPMDSVNTEITLEQALLKQIGAHRELLGLPVTAESDCGYLLAQALQSYEHERVHGVQLENQFFEAAVRACVADGCTFKGYPMHFTHTSSSRVFQALLQSRTCKEIVETVGQTVRHCVRVKCTVYPEAVISVWVMLAVTFRPGPL